MPKKDDKIIEPINASFDKVAEVLIKPAGVKSSKNNIIPKKTSSEPAVPEQMVFDLGVEVEKVVNGIEMGVLENGLPYLTQNGLADLCGVARSVIYDIARDWIKNYENTILGSDRNSFLKEYLFRNGYKESTLYIETESKGTKHHSYPDIVCMAILEYYAFESKGKNDIAIANYRKLATYGLRKFIFDALGYSPDQQMLSSWRHFHDRLDMTLDSVPTGYFSVFREIASMLVPMIRAGIIISDKVVPDISVGRAWSDFWKTNNLSAEYGKRTDYDHDYPLYYPQAKSNPQGCFAYPDSALGVFRSWLREHYITNKFPKYLMGQAKQGKLPATTATKVLEAFTPKQLPKD